MRVLAIGDIVGRKAVQRITEELKKIKEKENIDFVIANAENSADDGNGISKQAYNQILNAGVDVITMGNHTWENEEIYEFIEEPRIIRPANVSKGRPGKGYTIYEKDNIKILVINLIGRKFMEGVYYSDNPFVEVDKIIKEIGKDINAIIVDFHASWTGEKFVMGYFLDGRVSAVYGTHTHVQTADEMVLPKGTGFITDIGMTGSYCSELGTIPENGLKRYLEDMPSADIMSENPIMINGCIFDIDETTGKTTNIKRIHIL